MPTGTRRSKPSPRFCADADARLAALSGKDGVLPSEGKQMAANRRFAAGDRAPLRGAQGSFDFRREAPGGPGTGRPVRHANVATTPTPMRPVPGPLEAKPAHPRRRRGESVKGGTPPFTKTTTSNRNSPPRAAPRRAREFRFPARSAGRSGNGAPHQTHQRPTTPTRMRPVPGPLEAKPAHPRRRRGESVKGGTPPFTKTTTSNRNSPPRAAPRRAREFRFPARSAGRSGNGAPHQTRQRRDHPHADAPRSRTARG